MAGLKTWGGNASEAVITYDSETNEVQVAAGTNITNKLYDALTGGNVILPLDANQVETEIITDLAGGIPRFFTFDTVSDLYLDRGVSLPRLKLISTEGNAITSINGDIGPEVSIGIYTLTDVLIPPDDIDGVTGQIIQENTPDGAALLLDKPSATWVARDIFTEIKDELDTRYAPFGSDSAFHVPMWVVDASGTQPPAEFPEEGVIIDPTLLGGAGNVIPSDLGFKAWTLDPANATATVSIDTGTARLAWLPCRGTTVITNIWCSVTTAGSGLTGMGAVIYAADGTRLGFTTTIVDAANSTTDLMSTGLKKAVLGTPITREKGENYYVGFFAVGTTGPLVQRGGSTTNSVNASTTSNFARFATTAAGSVTGSTPPNPMGSLTRDASVFYAVS